ncbi:MAG: hypothetical protein QXE81_06130 [Desulfurococcaceae archaeon]
MSRKLLVLLSIFVLVFVSGVIVGINLQELIIVNIKGVVNVPSEVTLNMSSHAMVEKDVEVNISTPHGNMEIDIGELVIPSRGFIIVSRNMTGVEGDFKLVLSGRLDIVSNNSSYDIQMPCLISINETCYRIELMIPGYDEPLEIQAGIYNAKLRLEWFAKGSGVFILRFSIHYTMSSNL